MTDIYVLDTETTGLDGIRYGDEIVEISIVKVCLETRSMTPVYSEVVGYDVDSWSDRKKNAWVFQNTDLTLSDVRKGKPENVVIEEVREILDHKYVTSYNTGFDMWKFLLYAPWSVNVYLAPDIMACAHLIVEGNQLFEDGTTSWPRLQKSYNELCPGDPAGMNGPQTHRAHSDTIQAIHVMFSLMDRGLYPTTEEDLRDASTELIRRK